MFELAMTKKLDAHACIPIKNLLVSHGHQLAIPNHTHKKKIRINFECEK